MAKLAKLELALNKFVESNKNVQIDINRLKEESLEIFESFENVQKVIELIKTNDDIRFLCRYHLFFLLIAILKRKHLLHKWTENRCIDCQKSPNGQLQLWSREHFKSSIWTVGRIIQDILCSHGQNTDIKNVTPELLDTVYSYFYPDKPLATPEKKFVQLDQFTLREEVAVGIFSATRTLAQAFLKEIMLEFEKNELLQSIFPDILYKNPKKFSTSWSFTHGITVKRTQTRRECTVEAWGLIEGQPTSKHFTICIYDDIVTHEMAKSLILNQKLVEGWENSFSLGSTTGVYRALGTRKHYNDPYSQMVERDIFKEIRHTPYDKNGESVLMPENVLRDRRKRSGETTFAAEYLQEPLKNSALGFNLNNLMYHQTENTENLALYLICDPASSKKKNSDYTAMGVIGIDGDYNILLLDGIRDRLNPSERWNCLFSLYKSYPAIKKIFYEETGMNNDLFYFKEQMNKIGHFFDNKFISLNPKQKKEDRIVRLEPLIEEKKLYLPKHKHKVTVANESYDLTQVIVNEELSKFPFCPHDDFLDVLAYGAISLEDGKIKPLQYDKANENSFLNIVEHQANVQKFLQQ